MTASYHKKYRRVVKKVDNWFSVSENDELHDWALAVGTDCGSDCAPHDGEQQENLDLQGEDVAGYDFDSDVLPISSTDDEAEKQATTTSLHDDLAEWVVQSKLPQQYCNGLLSLLIKHGCQLPKDIRTLLRTPRAVSVDKKCGGQFVYFGLHKILQQAVHTCSSGFPLQMQINIDGVPLYKSSSAQFWPVLCSVDGSNPMIAALYFGHSKPSSMEEFLKEFIDEVKLLHAEGFTADDRQWPVILHSFVCDAPARAMLKNIKAHNSLYGCERCEAKGMSIEGRTVFISDLCFGAKSELIKSLLKYIILVLTRRDLHHFLA